MAFKAGKRSAAFRKLISILQNDPVLRREIKVWRVWAGKPDDAAPPSPNQLPWVRFTPGPDSSEWVATETLDSPMIVRVETLVSGTNVDLSMDLWEAIEQALFRDNPDRRALVEEAYRENGILTPTITQPAYGVRDLGTEGGGLTLFGSGTIRLEMMLDL